ncbi:DUF4097 family beta strand repeat-containing protein [Fictibacillus enclensis]|uniref:DUF4097 family beta strand repeat-containing protein n=1 Tax=Fictibacillus enclensis TaxID=1017270 RepID=UPI0024C0336B|nr:DUF4097 domain-containing protein [Fictibacillus enclensis]WHY71515.1 DUF4097 domain-containing protein [Fictibacillus enclensis]
MEERKMILNMLNEGKISVEEAEKLLLAVNHKKTFALPSGTLGKKNKDHKKVPSQGFKVGKFLNRVVKRIKTADFDLNFGPHEDVHYIFEDRHVMFEDIDIEIYNGSITLVPWERNDVQIECEAEVYKIPEGTAAKTKFRNETFYDCDATRLRFYARNKHQKVNAVVSIPKKQYHEIKCVTFNGGIKTSDCQSRHLELKSTIGSLFVNRCGGDKLKAEASNGSITLKESNWKELVAETMNGPVRLNGKSEQIRIETINGSIYYRLDTPASGYASLKTVTGKIEAELPESLEVEASLKTYVGGLVSDFDGMEVLEQKKEVTKKFLRFIANKGSEPAYRMEAEAKTGSIAVLKAKQEG